MNNRGQLLHYAAACAEERLNAEHLCDFGEETVRDAVNNIRFFIVTETLHYALEEMCHFFGAYGINIECLAADCVLTLGNLQRRCHMLTPILIFSATTHCVKAIDSMEDRPRHSRNVRSA